MSRCDVNRNVLVSPRFLELVVSSRTGSWARRALVARVLSGTIFVLFGLGKFVSHATETASFDRYGLPAPGAFVYAVGVLELAGGILLLLGLAVRPTALVLAGNMVGAVVTAGRIDGGAVNLGLAPALFIVMVSLASVGAGEHSLDELLAVALRHRTQPIAR